MTVMLMRVYVHGLEDRLYAYVLRSSFLEVLSNKSVTCSDLLKTTIQDVLAEAGPSMLLWCLEDEIVGKYRSVFDVVR